MTRLWRLLTGLIGTFLADLIIPPTALRNKAEKRRSEEPA